MFLCGLPADLVLVRLRFIFNLLKSSGAEHTERQNTHPA